MSYKDKKFPEFDPDYAIPDEIEDETESKQFDDNQRKYLKKSKDVSNVGRPRESKLSAYQLASMLAKYSIDHEPYEIYDTYGHFGASPEEFDEIVVSIETQLKDPKLREGIISSLSDKSAEESIDLHEAKADGYPVDFSAESPTQKLIDEINAFAQAEKQNAKRASQAESRFGSVVEHFNDKQHDTGDLGGE